MTFKESIKTIIFLTVFGVILISLTYMLRTNGDVKDIFTGFYAEEKETIDVIMIGSSPVYPFYAAPQIWGEYGIACYPLSSNVQRPGAIIPLMEESYKTQSPSVAVFEMRMFTMEDGDMASNTAYTRGVTDNLKYSWNRIYAINRLVTDKNTRYTYYFDIFKYHSNWRSLILPDQIASVIYERKHPLKGFVIRDEVGPLAPEEIPDYSMITGRMELPAKQEDRLRELLGYLKEQNQEALFIVSPYRLEADEQRMFNYMADLITAEGFRFINFNNHYEEIGIDFTTDYYDYGGHVNTQGAIKCTAFLGEILKGEYQITDKRHEAGQMAKLYQSWEEAYERYQKETADSVSRIEEAIRKGDFTIRN